MMLYEIISILQKMKKREAQFHYDQVRVNDEACI